MTIVQKLLEPPICYICERRVREVFKKAIGPGDFMQCKDCFFQWYDPDWETGNTKEGIKANVLRKHGRTGGEGVHWPEKDDT